MQKWTDARRVVGFAGQGVMPSGQAIESARETLGELTQQAPQCARVLQFLTLSVMPTESACKTAIEEINPLVIQAMAQRSNDRQSPSYERPRG